MILIKLTLLLMCIFNICFLIYIRSEFLNLRDYLIFIELRLKFLHMRLCDYFVEKGNYYE